VTNFGSNTLQLFDIANPAAPLLISTVSTGGGSVQPTSVFVQGRYAYVVTFGGGTLQVFDVANPAAPVQTGSTATGANPRSVQVQGRYAYVANFSSNTLQVIDVSNPAAPATVASTPSSSGAASVYVQGRHAFVACSSSNSLQAFDLGGAYLQQLEAGGLETGTLASRGNAQLGGDAEVKGGLSVGASGFFAGNVASAGRIGVGVYTNSCTPATTPGDCACNGGDPVTGGGGSIPAPGTLRESRPNGAGVWRVICQDNTGTDTPCAQAYAVCLSHGN
jgi:YVTN family beta-propeller protein